MFALALTGGVVRAADLKTGAPAATNAPVQKAVVIKKKLTGADLYAVNCNRCHPDRFPIEWRSAEGKTVITHMRVRANIPAKQADLILKYLQEESGN